MKYINFVKLDGVLFRVTVNNFRPDLHEYDSMYIELNGVDISQYVNKDTEARLFNEVLLRTSLKVGNKSNKPLLKLVPNIEESSCKGCYYRTKKENHVHVSCNGKVDCIEGFIYVEV